MRTSGILMPIFSLPSKYGIGTLGREAYNFVDFLKKSGQTYWQILPIGVTSFGDSPYQSFSSYAGNPYFVDLEMLCNAGYLNREEIEKVDWGDTADTVDYEKLYNSRYKVLRIAYNRFKQSSSKIKDYALFLEENDFWLKDYALFSALKELHNGASFDCWEDGYKKRDKEFLEKAEKELKDDIEFYKFIQYHFFRQWEALKSYANKNGVNIIGDIPIYVAYDSADTWSNKEQFLLDKDFKPLSVAGCPPDAFSEDGQLWGNPLYDWDYMESKGFDWWLRRIGFCTNLYDVVRIDHFRGFSAYFSIPYGDKTAVNGKWVKGPGKKLFEAINKQFGRLNIIAEDLGTLDDDVYELLEFTGYPGMKVLQFAFSTTEESRYLPHNVIKNCVLYTGTHDNDTAIGYANEANADEVEFMRRYLQISEDESFNWALIKSAMATSAQTVILQMQDFLGLDNKARINKPSTIGENWKWRIGEGCINDWLAEIILDVTKTYFRTPKIEQNCINKPKKRDINI